MSGSTRASDGEEYRREGLGNDATLFDAFISHSSCDKDEIEPIVRELQRRGVRVWFDKDQIKPGGNIPLLLNEGLRQSKKILIFLSANWKESDWTMAEWSSVVVTDPANKKPRIIVVSLDKTDAPPLLGAIRRIDMSGGNISQGINEIVMAVIEEGCANESLHTKMAVQGRLPTKGFFPKRGQSLFGTELKPVSVTISPDDRWIAGGYETGEIILWDTTTREYNKKQKWLRHKDAVDHLLFSPDGSYLFSAGSDGKLICHNVVTSEIEWQRSAEVRIGQMCLSSNSRWLLIFELRTNQLIIFDLLNAFLQVGGLTVRPHAFALSRHMPVAVGQFSSREGPMSWLACVDCMGKYLCIYSLPDLRVEKRISIKFVGPVTGIAWAPDNSWVAISDYECTKLFDIERGAEIAKLEHGCSAGAGVTISPLGDWLVVVDRFSRAVWWNLITHDMRVIRNDASPTIPPLVFPDASAVILQGVFNRKGDISPSVVWDPRRLNAWPIKQLKISGSWELSGSGRWLVFLDGRRIGSQRMAVIR
ncbi:MAG: TIR domain-containing protein [Propionibacteriaceae bacterium]|jgi:WD40 repeat protein|nr:TIR domain-containing protein [Propionibacteriaceae bacterium]